jgi:ABC-type transport system involved in cytochrome c biogenesis permease subunit
MMRAVCFALLLAASVAHATPALPADILNAAAAVAVQDGGRIKPLDTYARFTLLQLSGRTALRTADGGTMHALPWLLECWFDPNTAQSRAVFLIENPEIMEALGLAHGTPRERFPYQVLSRARAILFNLARQYGSMPVESRTAAQKQTLQLAHNLRLFESLTRTLTALAPDPDQPNALRLSDQLERAAAGTPLDARAVALRLAAMEEGSTLALLPPNPASTAPETWTTPAALMQQALAGQLPSTRQIAALRALENLSGTSPLTSSATPHLLQLQRAARDVLAGNRDYAQIPRELFFYRLQPFYWSLVLYILAFVLIALAWLFPPHRYIHALALVLLSAPLALHTTGIVLRCLIRGRPPVTTLYETLLFVTAIAVLVALLLELINRRRVAAGAGAMLGALGLFLAARYEAIDRTDTMPNLIAVLDTNFWLSTHVTTVTIGYAAGLLAGAIAHVYLFGKALGFRQQDHAFYKHLTRMVYGVFCFGLLFATVGTVLGGIWANESWGRFWGWDPKENGALMIVLWGLTVLHARIGGYIRDYGLHMAAVFGGIIVAFSWFGVNLLGIGLHSYGFTSGIHTALTHFYQFEAIVLIIAAFGWLREQGIVRIIHGKQDAP